MGIELTTSAQRFAAEWKPKSDSGSELNSVSTDSGKGVPELETPQADCFVTDDHPPFGQ